MVFNIPLVDVYLEDQKVGRLVMSPDRRSLFEYDALWISRGFSVSPFWLPLKNGVFTARAEPFEGLFGVFNDSLPDGWGNLLIDRWLMSKGGNPGLLTPLDRLCLVGDSGMGALTYRPSQGVTKGSVEFDIEFYATEAAKILQSDFTGSLEELVSKAGSSGGARPKVLIRIDGADWLIKFRAHADPEKVGQIEFEHALLAKKCGIEMAETRLFEGKYFGTKRFDRENGRRIHLHSAAGLLYASHRLPSLDYSELLKAAIALTRNMQEVEKLFRLMVFNVMIGNKDDHARNFSFLFKDGSWRMAPAYDLLPSDGFNGQHTTTINGKGNPVFKDFLEVADQVAIPEKTARRLIDEVMAHKTHE